MILAGQMQTNVDAFIILYVDWNLFHQMYRGSILSLYAFEISAHDVVVLAGGHAQSEFAVMVGIELPARFLIGSAADLHLDAEDGMIIRSPDRAED